MENSPAKGISKKQIYYTRDYRHFSVDAKETVVFLFCCVLPVTLVMLFSYPRLTKIITEWSGHILSNVLGVEITAASKPFFPHFNWVAFLELEGHAPSRTHVIFALIITVILLIIIGQVQGRSRPVLIYTCMGLYVLLFSCVFFLFWPDRFPYVITQYSEMYMLQFASLCVVLPTLFGIALSLLKSQFLLRLVALIAECAVLFLLNAVRYVVYIYFLYKCSFLYMATIYFTFGVLFDFIQMVFLFSFVTKRISESYNSADWRAKWDWS